MKIMKCHNLDEILGLKQPKDDPPVITNPSITNTNPGVMTFSVPNYKSTLKINNDVRISFIQNKPNWWWRFWQRVLLGFRWEDA